MVQCGTWADVGNTSLELLLLFPEFVFAIPRDCCHQQFGLFEIFVLVACTCVFRFLHACVACAAAYAALASMIRGWNNSPAQRAKV